MKIAKNTNPIFTEHFKGKKDIDFTLEDKRKIAAVLLVNNHRHELVKRVLNRSHSENSDLDQPDPNFELCCDDDLRDGSSFGSNASDEQGEIRTIDVNKFSFHSKEKESRKADSDEIASQNDRDFDSDSITYLEEEEKQASEESLNPVVKKY